MNLTEKDVIYVAELAHLELTEEEIKRFQPQLEAILEYAQKLNQLDTTNVEPMAQVLAEGALDSSLRPDTTQGSLPQSVAVASAPEGGEIHFKVPSVIEKE